MGSNNSFKNLTVAAVLAIVGALFYLIYQTSAKRKAAALEAARMEAMSDIRGLSDSLGTIGSSTAVLPSTAALPSDTVHSAVDGQFLSSPTKGGIREVTTEDPNSLVSATPKTKVKTGVKSKSPASTPKSGASTPKSAGKVGHEGGAKGDILVMAGSFASKDNADALVAKLKKLGFAHAEVVKLGKSANVNVIAGYYEYNGGAEAAVRSLKKSKVDAFIKKKDGDIFKVPATPKAAAVATKPS